MAILVVTTMSAAPIVLLTPIDRSALIGGAVLLGVGACTLLLWWLLTRRRRAWFHRRRQAEGTVTRVSNHADFSGTPQLEYTDHHGTIHSLRGKVSSPAYNRRDKQIVFYDPDNPALAITKDDLVFSRLIAAGGVALLGTGAACVIAYLVTTTP